MSDDTAAATSTAPDRDPAPDEGIVAGRVVIVTGAGQGLGAAHARAFAQHGAKVVVNDLSEAIHDVVAQIRADGGEATACVADVSDWAQAQALIETAVSTYGSLDTLVNNAGINRDRMLVSMSEAEWDAVMKVNLKGHFAPMRHAVDLWRARIKDGSAATAPPPRVVNTSSGAGLMGSVGQGNYAASKAGITALTQVAAAEWARYGIGVNAIAPSARTPMTETVFAEMMARPESGFDVMAPENVSPLVVWLGSSAATCSGRVFEVFGGEVSLADGWRHGEAVRRESRWAPEDLTAAVAELIARSPEPTPVYGASS